MVNKVLREHVTSTAFNLTLSKNMIASLVCIKKGVHPIRMGDLTGGYSTEVPTRHRLAQRGLVIAPDPHWPGVYETTRAGDLVFELLQEAGLTQEYEKALEQTK